MNEWNKRYSKLIASEQLLDLKKQSPENFIDDLKMDYLREYLPLSGTVVEIGAGSGRLLTRIGLENKNLKLIGLDYCDFPVKLIKENLKKYNLHGTSIKGNAYNIPIKSNIADAVLSGGFLEHFNEEEVNYIFREMYRILKPNGLLYADIVPGIKSLCRPIILTKNYGEYENKFSKEQWKELLFFNKFKEANVFRGCILPPNFYSFRSNPQLNLMYKLQSFINRFDKTPFADIFGFMYYVFARK